MQLTNVHQTLLGIFFLIIFIMNWTRTASQTNKNSGCSYAWSINVAGSTNDEIRTGLCQKMKAFAAHELNTNQQLWLVGAKRVGSILTGEELWQRWKIEINERSFSYFHIKWNKASVGSIFCKSGLEGLRKRKTILRVLGIGNQWTLRDAPHLQCPPSV